MSIVERSIKLSEKDILISYLESFSGEFLIERLESISENASSFYFFIPSTISRVGGDLSCGFKFFDHKGCFENTFITRFKKQGGTWLGTRRTTEFNDPFWAPVIFSETERFMSSLLNFPCIFLDTSVAGTLETYFRDKNFSLYFPEKSFEDLRGLIYLSDTLTRYVIIFKDIDFMKVFLRSLPRAQKTNKVLYLKYPGSLELPESFLITKGARVLELEDLRQELSEIISIIHSYEANFSLLRYDARYEEPIKGSYDLQTNRFRKKFYKNSILRSIPTEQEYLNALEHLNSYFPRVLEEVDTILIPFSEDSEDPVAGYLNNLLRGPSIVIKIEGIPCVIKGSFKDFL